MIAARAWALALAAALLGGCERVDGEPMAASIGRACSDDFACGAGRHCTDGGCALDCVKATDCGPGLSCSPCGRCVAPGQQDAACLPPTERPCDSDVDCQAQLGPGYGCGALGTCAARCTQSEGCSERGFVCSPERSLCEERCYADGGCYHRGFARACRLPAGVDPNANLLSETPTPGQCGPREGGLGFVTPGPDAPPSAAYQGVWAFMVVSAVRTEGLPVVSRIDTAAVQHLLVKAQFDGPDVVLTLKWCAIRFQNFHEKDLTIPSLIQIVYPERNVDSIDAVTVRARSVPALAPGATFASDEIVDLRGARLANPRNDPLPTRFDLTGQRDQDHDGHPGATSLSTGLLTGELYQAQRTVFALDAEVIDANHLHGPLVALVDTALLGASNPALINDGVSGHHPQPDRSYFRAERLADDATCSKVIDLAAVEGGWLAHELHYDPSKRP